MKKFHTFAVCAYGDSPYLEACLRSVTSQSRPTQVILCTSTPSSYLDHLAERYGIPVFVREGKSNIREDWNFAYEKADSLFVTIAHQDDVYEKEYVKTLESAWRKYPDMTLFTTDYLTVKEHQVIWGERLTMVKKILRLPLRISRLNHLKWIKLSALRFGNSICCPACSYNKEILGETLFRSSLTFALDWDNLVELARRPGRFICAERPLVFHRLHPGAETNASMKDSRRAGEEMLMFSRLWPRPAAALLMKGYQFAYGAYTEQKEAEE